MDDDSPTWRVGQRVTRKNGDEPGTVVSVADKIKVKWDGGATSYFGLRRLVNVRLVPSN